MKKSLITLVLVFAVASLAQTAPQQPSAPQGAGQPAQQGAPAQKKEIKDPAEYNAYMNAIQASDPNAKATALEGFTTQYPNSVMKEDALELLMRTYQQLGNVPKTMETANRVLQSNPNNVTALALLSYLHRAAAQTGGPNAQQDLAQARQFGEKGIQALAAYAKPEGMADADFAKLKDQLASIFNSSIGISALQSKDYPTAQKALQDAVTVSPTDFSIVYPLALSYLDSPQPVYLQGLWYIARAVSLAPQPQLKQQLGEYGRRKYIKFHGGEDGWTDIVSQAATSPVPPQTYAIKPAPTPAEQAEVMLKSKPINQMSFDEIQFILTSGNQQAADELWNQIKGKPIAMVGNVIAATPTKLTIAGSYDDINSTPPKADIELTMTADIPAKLMPKEGQQLQFQGKPSTYTPNPFMMQMEDGTLVSTKKATPDTPKKATTTRKKTTTRRK
jgi:tetratricopeptide (TPR) repeat protein